MNRFDFLISFVSIVYGLALTTFVSQSVSLIVNRREVKWHFPHTLWCLNWYSYMLLDWWGIFSWSDKEVQYWVYLFFYLKATLMVVISYLIVPAKQTTDLSAYFASIRGVFFSLLSIFILSDLVDSALHGVDNFRGLPASYFVKIILASMLSFACVFIKSPRAQMTIAVLMFLIGTFTVLTFR